MGLARHIAGIELVNVKFPHWDGNEWSLNMSAPLQS
jgi:hypothetical protein